MKRYFYNKGKYYLFILIIIIFLGIAIGTNYIIDLKKGFTIDNEVETIYKNNYKMEINYPVFNNKKVNNEISSTINNEKEKFLKTIDEDANYENELNVNYSYSVKDKVYSVHLRTYSYTGEESNYYRSDKIIYFDQEKNKELNLDDLIIDDKFYNVVKNECINFLNKQDNFELYDKEQFNEVIENKDSYTLIIFSEYKIYVIFTPHTISPYDGEISVAIDYDSLKKYLNADYFTSLETKNDKEKDTETSKEVSRIRDSKQFEGKKLVAITFDDGPAYSKTETLLTELEKRDARVSFFLLGELAIKQTDLVKKAYDGGHTIGSHTYDHKNLKKLDEEQLNYEINYTNEILSNIIGEDIKFIRPPYGSYNNEILEATDMSFILWSCDTEDWKLRDADKVAQYMVDNVQDGDIVLLHDIHQESVDGVIKGIDLLKEQGYEFVSLEELIAYRNVDLKTHTAYRYFRSSANNEEVLDKKDDKTPIEDIVATKNIDDVSLEIS